jgi:hypothetical protein
MLGLVRAASRWDGSSETRFGIYARKWCWGYIKRAFYREQAVSQGIESDNDNDSLERLTWDDEDPTAVSVVDAALSTLVPFEQWVIRQRYRIGEPYRVRWGILGKRSSLVLARRCGATTVSVRKAEGRALERMRCYLRGNLDG